jgi:hypothetical protein
MMYTGAMPDVFAPLSVLCVAMLSICSELPPPRWGFPAAVRPVRPATMWRWRPACCCWRWARWINITLAPEYQAKPG